MKRIVLLFIIFPIAFTSVFAQNLTEKSLQLEKLNQQVKVYVQQGKLLEASKVAQSGLELTKEIYGNEDVQTAVSYFNLGEIYKVWKKYDEAAENLQASLKIYQKQPEQYEENITQILESLGNVIIISGKFDEAQNVIENSVETAEKSFKGQDIKLLPYYKTASYFYMSAKKADKAANFFGRRFRSAVRVYGEDSDEVWDIENEFDCYISKFDSESKEELQSTFSKLKSDNADDLGKRFGTVNGRAVFLPKPIYNHMSKRMGIGGEVIVRVLIDEDGNVIKAEAFCGGDEFLRDSSEKAALKAKFHPTFLHGAPVRVSGTITYVFN